MYKFILFTVLCFLGLNAYVLGSEKIKTPSITYIEFNKHSYLCFNGKQFVHDPDCTCTFKFAGTFTDAKGKEVYLNLYRANVNLYGD